MRRVAFVLLAVCVAIEACGDGPSGGVEPSLPDAGAPADASSDGTGAPDTGSADAALDANDANDAKNAKDFCLRAGADGGDAGLGACLARLDLGGKKQPYYRSHALETMNPGIENLVVIQHGNSRNAWDYYDTIAGLAFARDPLHTSVIAPLFQTFNNACGKDPIGPDDLYWGCADWKEGNAAKNGATDSYAALDALIAAAKAAFPNLKRVTVAGYSAGGQTVQRYAAGNTEHDRTPAIATRYVVASPGTYLYLDGRRVKTDVACANEATCAVDATSFEVPAYAPGCVSAEPGTLPGGAYDDYKFGLANRTGYLAGVPEAALVANYPARTIVYVSSEGDSSAGLPGGPPVAYGPLDKDCPAMVQGPAGASFRLQRALVYHRYVTLLFAASHRIRVVPSCGHDEACVFGSPITQMELFGP